jgi:hypothetical protein
MALAIAKWDEFVDELDVVDQRQLMDPDTNKWEKIATKVDVALVGQPHIHRNGPTCKYKWMLQEFKKLADFHKERGWRSLDYFSITAQEKVAHKLPKNFYLEVYTCMNEWL